MTKNIPMNTDRTFSTRVRTSGKTLLTPREQEVLVLAAAGLRKKDIAHRLDIRVKTVETHHSYLAKKLGYGSSAELARAIREVIAPI